LGAVIVMKRAILLVLAMAALGGAAAGAEGLSTATRPANVVTMGCDQIIGTAKTGHDAGYRVVLGVVSAPPAALPGVVRVPEFSPFPYWRKAGTVIRASRKPVTVSVPKAWRRRVRIGWGNPASPASVVRFAACPSTRSWNGYAGGFFLRAHSACVPLAFAVGGRRATLRFGLGQHC
jgi:hypothetical protein